MSIKHAMLGFLSWRPLTGYDLKKIFAESLTYYWSGNNNQIYRTLVKLHNEKLVTKETEYQENSPPRKIYSITDAGRQELREWVLSQPEPPQLRNSFLIQLAWADQVDDAALDGLLAKYEEEVHVHHLMLQTEQQRHENAPDRTPREVFLWHKIMENWISYYEREVAWVREVRRELAAQQYGDQQ